jgi:hypothetical protein
MAYRYTQIKFRRVSNLRGNGEGDGGYAGSDFFVETHLEAEEVKGEEFKNFLIRTLEPNIKKILTEGLKRKTRPKR